MSKQEHSTCCSTSFRDRYNQKLLLAEKKIRLPDPYCLESGWVDEVTKWPPIVYGDIYHYLTNTPSQFTKDSMKVYKSLEAYHFFESGHVQTCFYNEIDEASPVCFMKAKVLPSQSVSGILREPWVCLHKEMGYVVSAHCNCMVGLGEACSHIAALLFKVEAAVRLGLTDEACASKACSWNNHYKDKVVPLPAAEINFTKPKISDPSKDLSKPVRLRHEVKVTQLSKKEQAIVLQTVKSVQPSACVLIKNESDTDSASEGEESCDTGELSIRFIK